MSDTAPLSRDQLIHAMSKGEKPRDQWRIGAEHEKFGFDKQTLRRPAYAAWMAVFHPVGLAVFHGLLAVVYFGVVTPLGLGLRLLGRDPLGRQLRRRQPGSYWLAHRPGSDPARYLRQS